MKSAERLYFPHIVETALPEGSKRLVDMHSFHRRHGIQARPVSIGHDEKGREIVQWYFAVPTIADFFQIEFRRDASAKSSLAALH